VRTITTRLLRRKTFYFSLLLAAILAFVYDFAEMRRSDRAFTAVLNDNHYGYEAEIDYYRVEGRRMRYVEIGHDSLPLIVFIHGAPSSSAFWEDLLRDSLLLGRAKLLAIDRPGYGYSGFGLPEISVKKQAGYIAELLQQKRSIHDKIVLHGSSYGGTVTARIAMDYPNLVDGILLQSASVAPGLEKTYWISYPTSHWLLKWLMPATIRVANAEKLSHRKQLEEMAPLWEDIRSAAIILHGTADELIFPKNAAYAKERLKNAVYLEVQMVKDKGHDLLWTGRHLLVNSLMKLISIEQEIELFPKEGERAVPAMLAK